MKLFHWRYHLINMLALVGFALVGCSSAPKVGVGVLDNAWQQYNQGMTALDAGREDAALEKFERAATLVESFPPALAGKSLGLAMKAARQKDGDHRMLDAKKALEWMERAKDAAKTPRERFIFHVTAVRIHTVLQDKRWLERAGYHHGEALAVDEFDPATAPYYRNRAAADYFMASARYKDDFMSAEPLLKKIVGSTGGGRWTQKANGMYEKILKISRAASYHTLSGVAGQIAVLDSVTRGDVAALLVGELQLDSLFAGRIAKSADKKAPEFTPADILDHPYKDAVATVMKWNLRGLTPIYDSVTHAYLFKPNQSVSRRDLAMILEDVLIQITGDEKLATRSIGQDSPFSDVAASVGWFNAVMTVTTRGLMKPDLSGEFKADDPVTGADLLLAVVTLRDVLNKN